MNQKVKLRSKALVETEFHCEKISEEEENEMNITTKSTHIMIFCICKLIKDNAEEDVNGTDDEIFSYSEKNELLSC